MKLRRIAHCPLLFASFGLLLAFCCSTALLSAQQTPTIAGDYVGFLGPLSLRLHVTASGDSSLACTLDSPNQGANGLPCADVHHDGSGLTFSVPVVHGWWKGSVSPDGHAL
jgi:hypothetical protein